MTGTRGPSTAVIRSRAVVASSPVRLEFVVRPPTGSWTKARQWETERTLFSSARATHVAAGEGQQRVVLQRRVAAYLVVGGQTPGATQRCLKPGCSESIGNSRRTGVGEEKARGRQPARRAAAPQPPAAGVADQPVSQTVVCDRTATSEPLTHLACPFRIRCTAS